MSQRTGFDKLFPDTKLSTTKGVIQESGNSPLPDSQQLRPVRWLKVNNKYFTNLDDGLYHSAYGEEVALVYDRDGKVVAYKNLTRGTSSEASSSGVIGSIAMVLILTAIGYYGGVWNFIWKGISEWWLTIFIIFCFSLYAIVWTPIFAYRESFREREGHKMLEGL